MFRSEYNIDQTRKKADTRLADWRLPLGHPARRWRTKRRLGNSFTGAQSDARENIYAATLRARSLIDSADPFPAIARLKIAIRQKRFGFSSARPRRVAFFKRDHLFRKSAIFHAARLLCEIPDDPIKIYDLSLCVPRTTHVRRRCLIYRCSAHLITRERRRPAGPRQYFMRNGSLTRRFIAQVYIFFINRRLDSAHGLSIKLRPVELLYEVLRAIDGDELLRLSSSRPIEFSLRPAHVAPGVVVNIPVAVKMWKTAVDVYRPPRLNGPGGHNGILGSVPPWVREDPRYRDLDTCKCRYSFNCPSPGLKFVRSRFELRS